MQKILPKSDNVLSQHVKIPRYFSKTAKNRQKKEPYKGEWGADSNSRSTDHGARTTKMIPAGLALLFTHHE